MWPWASYLTFLFLWFVIHKTGIIMIPPAGSMVRVQHYNLWKACSAVSGSWSDLTVPIFDTDKVVWLPSVFVFTPPHSSDLPYMRESCVTLKFSHRVCAVRLVDSRDLPPAWVLSRKLQLLFLKDRKGVGSSLFITGRLSPELIELRFSLVLIPLIFPKAAFPLKVSP